MRTVLLRAMNGLVDLVSSLLVPATVARGNFVRGCDSIFAGFGSGVGFVD